jgi:F-type H+-transporting ATPase subunit epsilon
LIPSIDPEVFTMSLTLRVLAPDQSVYDGTTEEVILPSTTGQMGILPGHVTMLAALDTGVMRLREGNTWSTIALLGGFAEVEADEITVLVNKAQLGSNIDPSSAQSRFEQAQQTAAQFEGQPPSTEKLKAQQALAEARAWLQATRATG